jgi:hypothetical protein
MAARDYLSISCPRTTDSSAILLVSNTEAIGTLTWLRRWPTVLATSITATVYIGLFAVANALLRIQSSAVQSAWLDWASTDLVNLDQHAVRSMIISALLDDGGVLGWIALSLIGLVAAGHTLGNLRCAILVTVAHVLGTVVSEGILAQQIASGAVPAAERVSLDIGPSYVVVAALTVGIAYGRWPARIATGVAFILVAPHLFGGLSRLEVGPVGHCCAIVVGVLLGFGFQRAWRSRLRVSVNQD